MTALNNENLLRAALRNNDPNAQQILDKWVKSAPDRQLLHHTLEGLLIEAADTNIPTMVEMLVKHIDPKLRESTPLYVAASKGHLDCVKILLPLSDPLVNKGDIYSIAIEKNQLDCLAVLLPAPSGMIATRVALTAVHLKNEDALDLILQHPLHSPGFVFGSGRSGQRRMLEHGGKTVPARRPPIDVGRNAQKRHAQRPRVGAPHCSEPAANNCRAIGKHQSAKGTPQNLRIPPQLCAPKWPGELKSP